MSALPPSALPAYFEKVLTALNAEPDKGHRACWLACCPAHGDTHPSLSIALQANGYITICCRSQHCEAREIVQAVGLSMSDLFPPKPQHYSALRSQIVATYDYCGPRRELLYQSVRKEPGKKFTQRRPDGRGDYIWDMQGVKRVLYRLPELQKGIAAGETVYCVEGEKDVHTLISWGLTATCNVGGAGKWDKSYNETLAFAHVVIVPDNDEAGRKHRDLVGGNLKSKAASVRVLDLPRLPDKGDVTDWKEAGGTKEEFLRLAEASVEWAPPVAPVVASPESPLQEPSASNDHHRDGLTDLGNAERLVSQHGNDIRFCKAVGWLIWNGRMWAVDETGEIFRRAKSTILSLYADASKCQDHEDRKKIVDHARNSEKWVRVQAMVAAASNEEGVPITANDLDTNVYLLNCRNGIIDLRTGNLLPHDRKHLITYCLPFEYRPNATAPVWNRFLERVMPDMEKRDFLQKFAGYSLTGDTGAEKLVFLYGDGRNGKSKYVEALKYILGPFAYTMDKAHLMRDYSPSKGATPEIAAMRGKRLVAVTEIQSNDRIDVARVKALTGGDTVSARHLHRETENFEPTFKLWLAGNHKPKIPDQDAGIWSRIVLIQFGVTIPEEERDEHLLDKFKAEASGILAWAVEGCMMWLRDGLKPPKQVIADTDAYKQEEDPLADFLSEKCVLGASLVVTKADLWAAYEAYGKRTGEQAFHSQRSLGTAISRLTNIVSDRSNGKHIWRGLALQTNQPDSDQSQDDGDSSALSALSDPEKSKVDPNPISCGENTGIRDTYGTYGTAVTHPEIGSAILDYLERFGGGPVVTDTCIADIKSAFAARNGDVEHTLTEMQRNGSIACERNAAGKMCYEIAGAAR